MPNDPEEDTRTDQESLIERLATEAEQGYDLKRLHPRPRQRSLFSNGTEWDWFQDAVCAHCRDQVEGLACDDAALPAVSGETPDFLVRVPTSPDNPLGVECLRFTPGED